MFETGPLRFIRMNLDKKAACVWIRDISAATVIKKKKKKKSSAASFFCATLIQCVCSSPPPPPKSLSGAPPFPSHISSLSLSAVVPCVQLTFSPNIPPPPSLCLYGIAMLMWKPLLVFLFIFLSVWLPIGWVGGGGREGWWVVRGAAVQ